MARRTFDVIDLIEIYTHWYAGRSQVQIADSLGIDRKTVRKYLAPVEAEGLVPGGRPVMSEAQWRAKAVAWFPQVADAGLRQVTWPVIEAHRGYIHAQLKAGVTVATIHQRDGRGVQAVPQGERPTPPVRSPGIRRAAVAAATVRAERNSQDVSAA